MPPRDNELPEGTDHIINGAMETNGGGRGGGAGGGGGGGGRSGGGSGKSAGKASAAGKDGGGFVGSGGGDDTGGNAGEGGGLSEQLRSQVSSLKDQAGSRVRDFASGGKTRASDGLEELSRVIADTADSIDERLGNNYGEYARRAADAVSGVADTLRRKEVDELYDDLRDAVRKSPGVAVGVAAVVGFTLVRLVKAGLENDGGRTDKAGGSGGTSA